ncbi:DUF2975 domain-containing protein [Cryobacterium sp. PH31-O1]|uniref:DUF2975 domain-containing protein n=1 Tax=Cryobacterium sp. PH31-O1 TaxID=3046306 RepID=UPI0024BBDE0B|nr:DUF2975 domain-containing protein [Cryobacterium sp. PH31-O1]MDJ0337153.1 DUF2975 domain-containing protein [Cryobacterium sp. PH31-O1]
MERTEIGPSTAAATATWLAIGLLGILILVSGATLFPISESLAVENPEFAHLQAPLLALALAVGLCGETLLVATAILVGYIRQDRIFGHTAARMVNLLILTVVLATILTASTLAFIPGPPALAIVIVVSVLVGITLTLVLIVLRSLLQRTALMRAELDEVV